MGKEKNYKKLGKKAIEDKVSNIIFIMKFLDSTGGLELVRKYFADAIPSYLIEYAGTGKAGKLIFKQLLKRNPSGNIKRVVEQVKSDNEFLIPLDDYEPLEIIDNQVISKINCSYIKKLIKQGKKFHCDFNLRDYYCKNACIPLLSRLYSDIFLKLNAELTKNGCIQRIEIDESLL